MGRSLYGNLHRRYGRRTTGAERVRHAREFQERLRAAIPLHLAERKAATGGPAPNVAVIGAGFAGCAAAFVLNNNNCNVTVYDANGVPGGRVASSTTIVSGRILEAGAELIGLNHPAWLFFADAFGFALGVVTPDDDYAGVALEEPLVLSGFSYDPESIYAGMTDVFNGWTSTASTTVSDPFSPWTAPGAASLDQQNLGAMIPAGTPAAVAYAIGLEFELNNTVPIGSQSWLANLAQFAAGQTGGFEQGMNFFDYTEVFRSTAGNQALAYALLGGLQVDQETVTAIDTSTGGVTLSFASGDPQTFDYVVVATSVNAWSGLAVDGSAFPFAPVQAGPAIKYLAPVASRFWIQQGLAPSSMADTLGMTWEGTDNQADTAGFELTVFAGGGLAESAIQAGGTDAYFAPLISAVYPGFSTSGGTFAGEGSLVQMGYSCPAPGQVTGAQQSYGTPYKGCVFVAGEHTSAAWFGFMEGALESGLVAAGNLLAAAS
jgi:monoamine oxidase